MKFKPWYLIALGFILFLYIVSPIFGSGYPLNQDLMPQYLRMMCLSENGVAPNNICPYINAGTPTSQYYYPVVDQLVAWIGNIIRLLLAYKIFLVLALIVPAIGIWIWLKDKHPFGAAVGFVTYLFYTAGWHAGGFQETILVGFASYMMSIGFLLIALYYFNKYLTESFNKDGVIALLLTPLILHPLTILVGIVCYLGLAIYHYKKIKENIWSLVSFIVCAVLINAFYILPLVTKLQFLPSNTGGYIDWIMFVGYIWNPISQAFNGIPVFPILSLIAIFMILKNKDIKNYPLLTIFATMILYTLLNFIINPEIDKYLIGIRLGALLGPLIIIMACLGIDYLYKLAE